MQYQRPQISIMPAKKPQTKLINLSTGTECTDMDWDIISTFKRGNFINKFIINLEGLRLA